MPIKSVFLEFCRPIPLLWGLARTRGHPSLGVFFHVAQVTYEENNCGILCIFPPLALVVCVGGERGSWLTACYLVPSIEHLWGALIVAWCTRGGCAPSMATSRYVVRVVCHLVGNGLNHFCSSLCFNTKMNRLEVRELVTVGHGCAKRIAQKNLLVCSYPQLNYIPKDSLHTTVVTIC